MMKRCCGEDRDTAFCPVCGTKLHASTTRDVLVTLAKYYRSMRNASQRRLEIDRKRAKEGNYELRPIHFSNLNKWERWLSAIEDVLANGFPKAPVPKEDQ